MTLSQNLKELLAKIDATPAWDPAIPEKSKLDISAIPENEIDETFEALNGLARFKEGLILNKSFEPMMDVSEKALANKRIDDFNKALCQGRVSINRQLTGRIGPMPGIDKFPPGEYVQPDTGVLFRASSSYCRVKHYWWGVRLHLSNQCCKDISVTGAAVASILTACGISAWIAAIVASIVGWIAAANKGKGVYVYITWVGAWWIRSA